MLCIWKFIEQRLNNRDRVAISIDITFYKNGILR